MKKFIRILSDHGVPLLTGSDTQTIDGVMLKGEWFDRNQLDKMLLDVEQLNE